MTTKATLRTAMNAAYAANDAVRAGLIGAQSTDLSPEAMSRLLQRLILESETATEHLQAAKSAADDLRVQEYERDYSTTIPDAHWLASHRARIAAERETV